MMIFFLFFQTEFFMFLLKFLKVFENFGTISEVKIKADGKAFIIFNEILDAYFAQTYLNNREIEEDKIKLKVDWCTPTEILEN